MDINIGKGITIPVDPATLPANVMEHVVRIGLRNILMDSHAGITTDEPDYQAKSRAVAEKKLEAMLAGEVRVAGTREGDPVRAEAIRLATDAIKSALRKAGRKLSDIDAKVLRAKAVEAVDTKPQFLEKAAELVAERKSLDVGDLGDL